MVSSSINQTKTSVNKKLAYKNGVMMRSLVGLPLKNGNCQNDLYQLVKIFLLKFDH